MIRIRLRRTGKTHHPTYRLVAADKMAKRDGRFLEILGSYDPHTNPPTVQLDTDRVQQWLKKGAQPSEAAHKILVRAGIVSSAGSAQPAAPAGPEA